MPAQWFLCRRRAYFTYLLLGVPKPHTEKQTTRVRCLLLQFTVASVSYVITLSYVIT